MSVPDLHTLLLVFGSGSTSQQIPEQLLFLCFFLVCMQYRSSLPSHQNMYCPVSMRALRGISEMKPLRGQGLVRVAGKKKAFQ